MSEKEISLYATERLYKFLHSMNGKNLNQLFKDHLEVNYLIDKPHHGYFRFRHDLVSVFHSTERELKTLEHDLYISSLSDIRPLIYDCTREDTLARHRQSFNKNVLTPLQFGLIELKKRHGELVVNLDDVRELIAEIEVLIGHVKNSDIPEPLKNSLLSKLWAIAYSLESIEVFGIEHLHSSLASYWGVCAFNGETIKESSTGIKIWEQSTKIVKGVNALVKFGSHVDTFVRLSGVDKLLESGF